MDNNLIPSTIGLVGERGSGKTQFVIELIKTYRDAGLRVEGIFCPGIFHNGEKVAIEMVDLSNGHSRLLARLATDSEGDFQHGDWAFYQETFDWGNQIIKTIVDPDVVVIDELGPLELSLNQGLVAGLELMKHGTFKICFTTARPKCENALAANIPGIDILHLASLNQNTFIEDMLRIANGCT